MTQSFTKKIAFKKRALINLTNAVILARLNGSTVISGFPKTGTTYLSHVAQFATGRTYIEGSQRLALSPSVIHCHFRNLPDTAVFSYRPIAKVIASYVTHLLNYGPSDIFDRLTAGVETPSDIARIHARAVEILSGTPRMPNPSTYYAHVIARGGTIIPIEDLADPSSSTCIRLAKAWKISQLQLQDGIARASVLADQRTAAGNEFYNRPSARIREILYADPEIATRIINEAAATRAVFDEASLA